MWKTGCGYCYCIHMYKSRKRLYLASFLYILGDINGTYMPVHEANGLCLYIHEVFLVLRVYSKPLHAYYREAQSTYCFISLFRSPSLHYVKHLYFLELPVHEVRWLHFGLPVALYFARTKIIIIIVHGKRIATVHVTSEISTLLGWNLGRLLPILWILLRKVLFIIYLYLQELLRASSIIKWSCNHWWFLSSSFTIKFIFDFNCLSIIHIFFDIEVKSFIEEIYISIEIYEISIKIN